MKKRLFLSLMTLSLLFTSCNQKVEEIDSEKENEGIDEDKIREENEKAIKEEIKGCYNFFKTSTSKNNSTFGLVRDRLLSPLVSSIASTGFALASYPIFVELGLMEKEEAKDLTYKTFDTILSLQNNSNESYKGCLYHFIDMNSGIHISDSEISTIDTAILLGGIILSYNYFNDQDLINKGREIWSNVNYVAYSGTFNKKENLISMGAKKIDGQYSLLSAPWDMTAEQLMLYIFGAGNPKSEYRLDQKHYNAFNKPKSKYNEHEVYYTWNGSIFTYQFSHAFIDFDKYIGPDNIDWFKNSIEASLASYEYSIDNEKEISTYSKYAWGLTACDTPSGYSGSLGALPRGGGKSSNYHEIEGTIAPCGALGSIIFTPNESLESLKYYQKDARLNDEIYGLKDAYCLDYKEKGRNWYCSDYIGIDKGITTMMLYNYLRPNFTQNLVTNDSYIQEGLNHLGFKEK